MFTLLIFPPSHSVKSWGMKWFCHCQQIDNWVCFDFLGCPFPIPMLLDWHLQKHSRTYESGPTVLKEKNTMEILLSPSQYSLVCTQPATYLGRRSHLLFCQITSPWYSFLPVVLKEKIILPWTYAQNILLFIVVNYSKDDRGERVSSCASAWCLVLQQHEINIISQNIKEKWQGEKQWKTELSCFLWKQG